MEREMVEELLKLMDVAEGRIGESCIEYVGYGYMKDFANFLYNSFKEKNLERKNLNITRIWTYLDVLADLEEDLFDGEDDYYSDPGLRLVAEFLVSDYCKDECYNDFIERMNAYIHGDVCL